MSTAPALAPTCANHPDVATGLRPCSVCGHIFCGSCVIELQGRVACASCKDEVVRDLRSGAVEMDYAGAGKRFVAIFLDSLIIHVPVRLLLMAFMGTAVASPNAAFTFFSVSTIVPGVLFLVYEALMTAGGGQTVGKKIVGIKVVTAEGNDVGPTASWVRAASRLLMGWTMVLGLIDALMVFSDKRRTLHDRISKTVVVNWRA